MTASGTKHPFRCHLAGWASSRSMGAQSATTRAPKCDDQVLVGPPETTLRRLEFSTPSRTLEFLFHHDQLVSGFRPSIDATQQGPNFLEPCLFEVLRRQGGGCFVGTGAIDNDFRVAVVMLKRRMHVLRVGRD